MTVWIVVSILAVMLSPLAWLAPSRRQGGRMALRMEARRIGLGILANDHAIRNRATPVNDDAVQPRAAPHLHAAIAAEVARGEGPGMQAEAVAVLAGGETMGKDPGEVFRRDAFAIVLHADLQVAALQHCPLAGGEGFGGPAAGRGQRQRPGVPRIGGERR